MNDEMLIYYGSECKALDEPGKVGGYLVLFGDEETTDASSKRDYFTPETDFGLDLSTKSRLLYHHGLDADLGARSLGVAELKADASGIWMEAQLKLRDEYENKIMGLVKAGKMGLSSGTASHLVRRERRPGGAHKVLSWPLGLDASITPAPAETRTSAVALKSLFDSGASSESFLDACLASVSELERAASHFAKVGQGKRDAIKSLRDSLDAILERTRPRPDPRDVDLLLNQFLSIESRLVGSL